MDDKPCDWRLANTFKAPGLRPINVCQRYAKVIKIGSQLPSQIQSL